MNTQPAASSLSRSAGSAGRRLAAFAVGILLLTGCQAGWGATAEQPPSETPSATAPVAREAAAQDPG